jgi:hypothetical protein
MLINRRTAIILLNITIFFLSFRYFLKECPIAAQAMALVDVDITKHKKININSI